MSAERETLSFAEDVDAEHDVDPTEVDWQSVFDGHAGSDGLIDMSTRVDVVTSEVDGIENSRQAESLLKAAADAGEIDERNGDYYISVDDETLTADDVNWYALFEDVAEGVTNPLPSTAKRKLLISSHLGLEDDDQVGELVNAAFDRGIIARSDGKLYLSDALEEGATTKTDTSAGPEPEPEFEPDDESADADRGDEQSRAETRPEPSEMERGELEQEVSQLRQDMDVMESRVDSLFDRMETMTQAVFGGDSVPGDPEKSEDMLTKFAGLRDQVDEHDEKLSMVSGGGSSQSTPDQRAMSLRTALYDDARQHPEKKAVMTRDQAKFALSGGLSRAQMLDAMRRAADGDEGDINGSSSLEPVAGLEFVKGEGRGQQSKIRLNIAESNGDDLRTKISSN